MKAFLLALSSPTSQQLNLSCNGLNGNFMIHHGKKFETYRRRERMLRFRKYNSLNISVHICVVALKHTRNSLI